MNKRVKWGVLIILFIWLCYSFYIIVKVEKKYKKTVEDFKGGEYIKKNRIFFADPQFVDFLNFCKKYLPENSTCFFADGRKELKRGKLTLKEYRTLLVFQKYKEYIKYFLYPRVILTHVENLFRNDIEYYIIYKAKSNILGVKKHRCFGKYKCILKTN